MSKQGEGLPEKKNLPSYLHSHNFIVEIPMTMDDEDDEEGLVEDEIVEDIALKVVKVSNNCTTVRVGDDVILGLETLYRPIYGFRINKSVFYIFSEHKIIGKW